MTTESIAPHGVTDSNESAADNWVPVAVESLRYATDYCFDLYIRDSAGKAPFRLFRGHDVPMTDKDVDQLLARGVHTLFTSASKAREYRDFLRERVLGDESLPLTRRYEVLTQAARVVFEEAFEKRDLDAVCEATGELAVQLTDLVNYGDIRLFDLVEVMLHDYSTYAHATRVCSYSLMLAQGLGIDDRESLAHIAEGALLHDVGKLFISDSVVVKNYRVTPEERELMRSHPVQGFRRLAVRNDIDWGTLMMVYQHHERADGCGFPVGSEKEEIHPWARICAIANTHDTLTRDVSIDDPLALKKVYENLDLMSGRSLDEEMTQCWLKIFTNSPLQA